MTYMSDKYFVLLRKLTGVIPTEQRSEDQVVKKNFDHQDM